jgi:hypothetical protein
LGLLRGTQSERGLAEVGHDDEVLSSRGRVREFLALVAVHGPRDEDAVIDDLAEEEGRCGPPCLEESDFLGDRFRAVGVKLRLLVVHAGQEGKDAEVAEGRRFQGGRNRSIVVAASLKAIQHEVPQRLHDPVVLGLRLLDGLVQEVAEAGEDRVRGDEDGEFRPHVVLEDLCLQLGNDDEAVAKEHLAGPGREGNRVDPLHVGEVRGDLGPLEAERGARVGRSLAAQGRNAGEQDGEPGEREAPCDHGPSCR